MEIKLQSHLPPPERVEVFLKGRPDLTWEEAEVRLSSLWVECPAKGTEVSMGESCCQGCFHLKRIDYQHQSVECNYDPAVPVTRLELILPVARMLDELREDDIPPFIVGCCPLTSKVGSVMNCIGCLYYRGEEDTSAKPHRHVFGDQVGWLLCAAPALGEARDEDSGMFVSEY